MKKESKNPKALISRFILLIIFILLIDNRTPAQCVDNTTCACEQSSYDIDYRCVTSCTRPVYEAHRTQLDCSTYGLCNVTSVTISATRFLSAVTVGVTQIRLYEMVGPSCSIAGGTPADGYDVAGFNAIPGSNITFGTAGANVTISKTGTIGLPNGCFVDFIVNVSDGSGIIASRNYFFKITSNAYIIGDTHITTVDGATYDFQAVGEFVTLLAEGGDNLEIQTRQTAYSILGPGFDPYSGLTTCVSVNTAVAARVGAHRVTYQPNINGQPDSSGMQLRLDGKLTELGDNGIDLGSGGRVMKSPAGNGTIEIDFPDGTSLIVTPIWVPSFHQWFLQISIKNTAARKGISGALAYNNDSGAFKDAGHGIFHRSKSWLPALPDGSSLGPMSESLHDRFVTLYQTFADAWRVTDATSLFDYAPGTSTATFTDKNWPAENGQSCSVAGQIPNNPITRAAAEELIIGVVDSNLRTNAIFDVMVTGEPGFANAYLLTQKIQTSTTATILKVSKDTTNHGDSVTFTAIVSRKFSTSKDVLTGTIEFTVDGKKLDQVKLEANGRAILTTTSLKVGKHQVAARFIPGAGGTAFSSNSAEVTHIVIGGGTQIFTQWWFWALLILILLILFFIFWKKKP